LNSAHAGARGVEGNLHLAVPSMNRLNQTDSVIFSILLFFRNSVSPILFRMGEKQQTNKQQTPNILLYCFLDFGNDLHHKKFQ
jgi:hypothetical protein